uniref:Uncharacterized protein n=1 Tax=Rhizophora mucronata TaxID=61149 RepID=A0A2P2PHD2_RHIMU
MRGKCAQKGLLQPFHEIMCMLISCPSSL